MKKNKDKVYYYIEVVKENDEYDEDIISQSKLSENVDEVLNHYNELVEYVKEDLSVRIMSCKLNESGFQYGTDCYKKIR